MLQPREALQPHIQNLLGLSLRQPVAVRAEPQRRIHPLGAERTQPRRNVRTIVASGRTLDHFAGKARVPGPLEKALFRDRWGRGGLDQRDHLVDVGQRNGESFQQMASFAGFAQLVNRAPCHYLAAMRQETLQHLAQIQQTRLAVDQGHHVHAERVLQLGRFVQIIEYNLRDFAALELNHDTHPGLIRLVPNIADPFDLLLVDQLGHSLEKGAFVDLVGQLVDDDRLATRGTSPLDILKVSTSTHHHPPAPCAIALAHARESVNDSGCWKVWGRNFFNQFVNGHVGTFEQKQTAVEHLVEVVWRHVRRHTNCDPGASVDQQIRNPCWQNQGLALASVIVGAEINGFAVNVGEQFVGNSTEPDLGVTHRCGIVAVDRAKVALAVDQQITQREMLRHSDDRVVNRAVAMRVVFTNDIADDPCTLLVRPVPVVVEFMHCKQHATMNRLESIPNIGQCPPYDYAHCII